MAKKKSRSAKRSVAVIPSGNLSLWNRQSDVRQHAIIALLLIGISFGFFAPIHFSSKQLVGGDTVQWISMANAMLDYEQETGDQALWATNAFAGMPGFMISYPTVVPQADMVVNFMRAWMWPSSHFLLLLFGMYLLTWYLSRDKLAGLFSAIAFSLTTYIPVFLVAGHNSKFVAVAWAPWLLLAFVYTLRKPSLKAGLLFAIVMALNLRAGHVQITYYTTIIIAIWWIFEAVHAVRSGSSKLFWQATAWLVAGSVAALLMIAQPYLAQAQYKQYTIRGASPGGEPGGMSWEYAMAWSQGFGELLTLLVADAYGGSTSYWGPKLFTGGPHYFGVLTIVLAIVALLRKRDTPTLAFGVAGFVMILFALGEHLSVVNRPMFNYFPMFDAFRVPETWLVAVSLVTSALAGIGIASLLRHEQHHNMWRPALLTFGATAGFLFLLLIAPGSALDFEKSGESERLFQQIQSQYPGVSISDPQVQQVLIQEINRRKTERRDLFASDTRRSLLFLAFGLLIVYLFFFRKLPGWLVGFTLSALIFFDLAGVDRRYFNADKLTISDSAEEEVQTFAFDSFIRDRIEEEGGPGHLRVLSLEFGLDPRVNARPSYFYESLGGYHGAKLRLYQDFLENILFSPSTNGLNATALNMMNTRYVVGRRAVPGYEMVFQDDASRNSVFENPDVLPRAFFVSRAEVIVGSEETWSRLHASDFDPAETVILTGFTDRPSTAIDSSSTAIVNLVAYTPREIVWRVNTDAPRWLVVSELYYPAGWTAEIDDLEAEIHQADYLLRAVHVPEGEHSIRMRFDPPAHLLGVWISRISTTLVYGGLVVLLLAGLLRRRHQRTEQLDQK